MNLDNKDASSRYFGIRSYLIFLKFTLMCEKILARLLLFPTKLMISNKNSGNTSL